MTYEYLRVLAGKSLPFEQALDLAKVTVTVETNGVEVEQAIGAEVLGNPIHSVMWLAKALARRGRLVKQGSLIMSGSFTRQYALAEGDHIRANFEGVGSVSAQF